MAEEEDSLEAEIVYPITCGDSRANLIWRKFVCPGINVKCVQVGSGSDNGHSKPVCQAYGGGPHSTSPVQPAECIPAPRGMAYGGISGQLPVCVLGGAQRGIQLQGWTGCRWGTRRASGSSHPVSSVGLWGGPGPRSCRARELTSLGR